MDAKLVYLYGLIVVILILSIKRSDSSLEEREVSSRENVPPSSHYLSDDRKKYPYLISLQKGYRTGRHFCNGALIGRDAVLTTAVCCQKDIFEFFDVYAVGASLETDPSRKSEYNKVELCLKHPDGSVHHNIAIVRLQQLFKFNIYLRPIKMAVNPLPADVILEVTGWGSFHSSENEQRTKALQSLKLRMSEESLCTANSIIPLYNATYMLCATIVQNYLKDFGFCVFDYGIPLTHSFRLYGIGFSSIICNVYSNKTEYTYFSYVPAYRDWITRVTSIEFRKSEIPIKAYSKVGCTSMSTILSITVAMSFITKIM